MVDILPIHSLLKNSPILSSSSKKALTVSSRKGQSFRRQRGFKTPYHSLRSSLHGPFSVLHTNLKMKWPGELLPTKIGSSTCHYHWIHSLPHLFSPILLLPASFHHPCSTCPHPKRNSKVTICHNCKGQETPQMQATLKKCRTRLNKS